MKSLSCNVTLSALRLSQKALQSLELIHALIQLSSHRLTPTHSPSCFDTTQSRMSAPPSSRTGWPIRRQARCYGFETGHHTWDKYWSCCPPHTEEFIDKDSKTYCYLDDTAKDKDLESPAMKAAFPSQCANSTQVLWAYDGNYFCCEDSLTGFVNEWVSLGCAPEEEVRVGEDNELMWGADLKGQPDGR